MAALDLDTDGLRQSGTLLDSVAAMLAIDLGSAVPSVGNDAISVATAKNLNDRRRWLSEHIVAGRTQVAATAKALQDTAGAYEAEDAAAAAANRGGASPAPAPSSTAAPERPVSPSAPTIDSIPDLSGRDGEEIARSMELGAGTGPALAAAGLLQGAAAALQAVAQGIHQAHMQALAAGEAQISAPLSARLTQAIAWAESASAHSTKLGEDYGTVVAEHGVTLAAVKPSATWMTVRQAYNEALEEYRATGGLTGAEDRVLALKSQLDEMQQESSVGVTQYQGSAQLISAVPPGMPEPKFAPGAGNTEPKPRPGAKDPNAQDLADKLKDDPTGKKDKASSGQDLISSMLGMPAKLAESAGKANPLSSAGQAASQLGQFMKPPSGNQSMGKPAQGLPTSNKPAAGAKGIKGAGGGGQPLKVSPSLSPSSGIHGAAATTTPTTPSIKPVAPSTAAASTGTAGGGGMGMMPGGGRGKGTEMTETTNYEQFALSDPPEQGRPGVEGETAAPSTVLNEAASGAQQRVRQRQQRDQGAADAANG